MEGCGAEELSTSVASEETWIQFQTMEGAKFSQPFALKIPKEASFYEAKGIVAQKLGHGKEVNWFVYKGKKIHAEQLWEEYHSKFYDEKVVLTIILKKR